MRLPKISIFVGVADHHQIWGVGGPKLQTTSVNKRQKNNKNKIKTKMEKRMEKNKKGRFFQ